LKNKRFVQAFGKLPIYADYISHVFDNEAAQWKQYLMEVFQKQFRIDEGLHPFIYNLQKNKIVGTIEPSNDGIREFPFSLFIVKSVSKDMDGLDYYIHIWHYLMAIRWKLTIIDDIHSCYSFLETCSIDISQQKQLPDEFAQKLSDFLEESEQKPLTIANNIDFTFGED